MPHPPTVGIAGGGIAGLVSAYYLAQKATRLKTPHLRILLFDRASRYGGWIRTRQLDSHVFELGARTLRLQSGLASLSNFSAINTIKLLEQLQLFDQQFCPIEINAPANKNKLIYYKKNLINLNNLSMIYGGKPLAYPPVVYLLYEYFAKAGRYPVQDETIKSFINRRLGGFLADDIVEYLLDPVLKGIYAGSVTTLSARTVLKKLFVGEQRYGSVIEGLRKSKADKRTQETRHFLFDDLNLKDYSSLMDKFAIYYLRDGMEVLVRTLVDHLQSFSNVELLLNHPIDHLHFTNQNPEQSKVEIYSHSKCFPVDHIISALPAFELATILDKQTILKERLNRINFVNMIVINLLYDKIDIYPKEAFGYLIPSREHSHLLGVLFDSCIRHKIDKSKHGSQLTIMMGGAWYDELHLGEYTDEQLMHIVQGELKKQMKLDEKPSFYLISRLYKAIPNYNVGHQDILDDINAIIRRDKLPLTLVGNSYRGVGINDVIYDARMEIEYLNFNRTNSENSRLDSEKNNRLTSAVFFHYSVQI